MFNWPIVVALILLAGVAGWWLHGVVDSAPGPQRGQRTEGSATEQRPATADPAETPPPQPATSPWEALVAPRPSNEDAAARLKRILGDDAHRAEEILPDLLQQARADQDERRARGLLELMIASGSPALRALVLEALVTDDIGFDFSHRDDVFRRMLSGVAMEDVGIAALRRLQWEVERGENSDGEIGGYAYLVGASRLSRGVSYLREMLAKTTNHSFRNALARALAASGEPAALEQIAKLDSFDHSYVQAFLDRSGPEGWRTLERLADSAETKRKVTSAIARMSAQQERPETAALLERMWEHGHKRSAIDGCMWLRPGTATESEVDRLRDIVYAAVQDDSDQSRARRGAFYAIKNSSVFQTERARAVLADIIASEAGSYYHDAARAALRSTEKALRRAAAQDKR